ncbi:uncharacterized protein LOC125238094 [Leguminivora glycinivorella]|uniref:uncharacterized protein LOC125238094 n=1 Tax=Leguminivora glycinivorella TaxID=1035111 RepID=UPI00200E08E2|nr:uncharacterized protein LOC125238094 [Leguminivora glycinivorella]
MPQINSCSIEDQNNMIPDDEDDGSRLNLNENISLIGIRGEIHQWALKYQIPHNALNELLHILRENSSLALKDILPADSRTLLKTSRRNNIVPIGNGEYWYYGLEQALKNALSQVRNLPSNIFLTFNIDGLPIARSTKKEFWPILCKIKGLDMSPIVVAIFFGSGKPPLEPFLRPFVDELLKLLRDGFKMQGRIISVEIRCFVCDTPARCFIKGTVGFNSYHGCMKCTVIGDFDRRGRHMSFPRTDMPLRNDNSFRNRLDPDHHKERSAIEDLPIDLVNDFTIADSLHLLDLGVMKKCLLGWTSGSFNFHTKWSARETQNISRKLMQIKSTTPYEVHQGRLRELDSLHFWKGTEFKIFLLYYGPVILKEHLPLEVYHHFLILFCATTICYSDTYSSYRHISQKLYVDYIERFAELYGQDVVAATFTTYVML